MTLTQKRALGLSLILLSSAVIVAAHEVLRLPLDARWVETLCTPVNPDLSNEDGPDGATPANHPTWKIEETMAGPCWVPDVTEDTGIAASHQPPGAVISFTERFRAGIIALLCMLVLAGGAILYVLAESGERPPGPSPRRHGDE